MSDREMHFPPISGYPKNSDTAMSADAVEAWLDQFPQKRAENKPNGGIIQSLADTSAMSLRELSGKERKAARAKAQREHKQALKNLAKQEASDAKEIAKQLNIWKREQRKKEKDAANKLPAVAQQFLDTLKKQGFYKAKDFPKSKSYMQIIVRQLRALGYQIKAERESKVIIRYILVNKKP